MDIESSSTTVTVAFSDVNGQPLPNDTSIRVVADVGDVVGTTTFTQATTNVAGSSFFSFDIADSNTGSTDSGRVTITATTPKGNVTEIYFNIAE